jgi:glycogen synthase
MRILQVSEDIPYPSMGGLAKHVFTLTKALIKAGHQVDILGGNQHPIEVAGDEGQFDGRFFGELRWHLLGWKESKIGAYIPLKRPWIARKMAQCIISYAANYDAIHYHGHYPNIAKYIPKHINFTQTRHDQGGDCLINSRFRHGGICTELEPAECAGCITSQPNALQRSVSSLAVRRYREDVAESFLRHKTIFVSDMLRRNFSRVAGNKEWGTIIHNFVDLDNIRSVLTTNPTPPKTAKKTVKLFFAGKLVPYKGIDAVLQKLAPVMPEHIFLTIVGNSANEPNLRKQFESEQIIFYGWKSPQEVLQIAANADVILVPSIWEEPCATTIFEGLMLGKPTYALERGGTPELKFYERFPGQLHLHKDIDSLVAEVINFKLEQNIYNEIDGRGGVDQALHHILGIYQAPLPLP